MTEKTDPKVFVTVVRQPTKETLLNIAHGLKQQNKRLREKLAANAIRGLATIKVKP